MKPNAGSGNLQFVVIAADDDEYVSETKGISRTYINHQHIWSNNPDDSAAWEDADINNGEFGIKLIV